MEQVQGSGAATTTIGDGTGDDGKVQPSTASPSPGAVNETQPPTSSDRVIKPEDHRRAVDDMMKFKREAQEARQALETERVNKLKEKENWKELYEQEKARREDEEGKRQRLHEGLITGEKWNSVEKELLKAGIRSDAMKIMRSMELTGVEAEFTTQGRVLVHGADSFVESIKREYPFAFQTTGAPTVNSGGAGSMHTGPVTRDQVIQAELESKKDPTKRPHYDALYRRFAEQKNGAK